VRAAAARLDYVNAPVDRYAADSLVDFARALLVRAGVRDDIAALEPWCEKLGVTML
jgi:hypothetical protein